jgi:hypothetical protein
LKGKKLPEAETSESSIEEVDGERLEMRVLGETVLKISQS